MKKNRLVVNTLVYLNQLKAGVAQAQLLKPLCELGVENVEIRREFIKDFKTELLAIAEASLNYKIKLFYSVPSYLYENGKLMMNRLESFYAEAQIMGCRYVKLNIGDVSAVTKEDIKIISSLCEKYNITQSIENDQTPENGKSEKINWFLEETSKKGGKITLTFDTGNWIWTRESPKSAAKLLQKHVTYIHVKDVLQGTPPTATWLGEGDLCWESILKQLPANAPVALEYPCDTCLDAEIQKLLAADI